MIAIPTIRDLSRVRGACAASVWLLCAAAGCADANLETSRIGTDSGIEDGGGQDASTPDAHVPSSCTDGVDCYCDRASDASDPLYDPDMLFCEDFEAFSNTNASLWNARYGSSVASCGAGSTRAGPAPDACINFLTEGACDAQGGDPGNDCVLDGHTALGFKYEQGRTGGIFGQANFAPTRTLGITYATKHTENFQPAGPAWKSNEYGKGWHCILGCSTGGNSSAGYFAANDSGAAMGGDFYPHASLWFSFVGGAGNAARFDDATVSRGAAFANDVQFGFTPLRSDFDPAVDNPRGQWVCRRVHIDGWGRDNARYREWIGDKLLIDVANFDASGILDDGSDPIDLFVWNHYFNGLDGTGSGYPGPSRAYRIEDNVHLTAGAEPVSCQAIGFPR